jgi:error-prone DNA polymerase
MHDKSRKALADVLTCIRLGLTLEEAGTRLGANAEARLRDEKQMLTLFREQPRWVHETGEVAAALNFELGTLAYHFPCTLQPGETPDGKLARLTWEGAAARYPEGIPEAVAQQLHKELALIAQLHKAPYFLSTW